MLVGTRSRVFGWEKQKEGGYQRSDVIGLENTGACWNVVERGQYLGGGGPGGTRNQRVGAGQNGFVLGKKDQADNFGAGEQVLS